MVQVKIKTRPRGIQIDDDVWAALNILRSEHGSVNAGLRAALLRPTRNGFEFDIGKHAIRNPKLRHLTRSPNGAKEK